MNDIGPSLEELPADHIRDDFGDTTTCTPWVVETRLGWQGNEDRDRGPEKLWSDGLCALGWATLVCLLCTAHGKGLTSLGGTSL